ncbi:hypothetical protein JL721_6473 [Aureococcus anophagefferens]|nr:hypothetical protein JL721_6473 [Aureococcus anophagefferens]
MMRLCALLLVFLCDAKPVSEREKLRREKRAQEMRDAQALDQQRHEAPLAAGAAAAPLAAARASHANASLSPLAAAPLAAAPLTNATSTLPRSAPSAWRRPAAWCGVAATWCKTHSTASSAATTRRRRSCATARSIPRASTPRSAARRPRRHDRPAGGGSAAGGAPDAYAKGLLRFVHVPKTGGTSVEKAFKPRFPKNHALAYDRSDLAGASVVAVIRDPYDRALSWFRFCIAGFYGKLPHLTAHCAEARRFHADAKKRKIRPPASPTARAAMAFERWLALVHGDAAYANLWVTTPLAVYLTHPATGEFLVDALVRFERLAADVAAWCAPRGCAAAAAKLASVQENPSRIGDDPLDLPYGALYTPHARAIVDAAWGVDADLFGYPFRNAYSFGKPKLRNRFPKAVATIEETARELPVEDAAFEVEKPDPGDADEVAKFDQVPNSTECTVAIPCARRPPPTSRSSSSATS